MTEFETKGMRELFKNFEQVEPRVRNNIARGMVYAAARQTRDDMRARAPVESGPARKQEISEGRKPGHLRKSIAAVRRRGQRFVVRAGVQIARTAFYWRFVEYGHGGPHPAPPHPFARPGWDGVKTRLVDRMIEYARARFEKAVHGD